MTASRVFKECVESIKRDDLITRANSKDKEFHFQDWFKRRLTATGLLHDQGGRNSYPDFTIVKSTDGYEIKGLAYPGRDVTFDSNSQVPTGFHNGRSIYYIFGRYPKQPDGDSYPVLDLVLCHGDFLNADHNYVHKNKSVKGFGSYGDIMIRDRKMYVVPTPFHIVEGSAHHRTMVLPADVAPGNEFIEVGKLTRIETKELIVGYSFDLKTNALFPKKVANPDAGKQHSFRAWRLKTDKPDPVKLRKISLDQIAMEADDEDD